MPIYEYECSRCGHRFELIQKVSDASRTKKCEKCSNRAERRISSPAIQFKGTGWYITDYARKGSGAESSRSDEASSKGSQDSGKKKEKKSAQKTGAATSSE